jgi:hypothetical protein
MNISGSLTLGDLTELEPAEHITDFTLFWDIRPSIEDVLPILKKWRQLRRLTLWNYENISVPPLEVISDFIMAMEHLSYLHIAPDYDASNYDELEILRDKVDELILPRRPNFKFDISLNFV